MVKYPPLKLVKSGTSVGLGVLEYFFLAYVCLLDSSVHVTETDLIFYAVEDG